MVDLFALEDGADELDKSFLVLLLVHSQQALYFDLNGLSELLLSVEAQLLGDQRGGMGDHRLRSSLVLKDGEQGVCSLLALVAHQRYPALECGSILLALGLAGENAGLAVGLGRVGNLQLVLLVVGVNNSLQGLAEGQVVAPAELHGLSGAGQLFL